MGSVLRDSDRGRGGTVATSGSAPVLTDGVRRSYVRALSAYALAAVQVAFAAVLGPLAIGGSSCAPSGGGGRGHGLLLIAVDGLRADHLTSMGYDRRTSPRLDELAEEGMLFTDTLSTAPDMLPAHVSLLTGCDPSVARRDFRVDLDVPNARRWRIPDAVPRLAVELLVSDESYATAAFPDHEWISPVSGFASGFQEYLEIEPGVYRPYATRGAVGLSLALRNWLSELSYDRSWFAYLQLHDLERTWGGIDPRWDTTFEARPELSWVPPVGDADRVFFAIPRSRWQGGADTLGTYEARYDGALRKLDTKLGRLFEELRVAGRFEETTICVVGTHGLQFGEEGLILDSGMLTMPDLHVPWILRPAAQLGLERGREITALASLSDVAPTLLELCGVTIPEGMHGVSMVPLLRGAGEAPRPHAFASGGLMQGMAVFDARWAYEFVLPGKTASDKLRASWFGDDEAHADAWRERIYLRRPDAGADDGAQEPPEAIQEELRRRANEWLARTTQMNAVLHKPHVEHAPDQVNELRRLGYLGGDA